MKYLLALLPLALAGCGGGASTVPTQAVAVSPPAVAATPPPAASTPPPSTPSPLSGYWIEPGDAAPINLSTLISDGNSFFAVAYLTPDTPGCDTMYFGTLSGLNGSGVAAQVPDGRIDYAQPNDPACGSTHGAEVYQASISSGNLAVLSQGAISIELDEDSQAVQKTSPVGSWTLQSGDVLTVDINGNVSLSEAATGCAYAGTISSTQQDGVYDLAVTATGCTSLPWNGIPQQGLMSFQGYAFGGTSFTDANGNPSMKLFE